MQQQGYLPSFFSGPSFNPSLVLFLLFLCLLFPASLAAAGTRPQLSIQFFIALIEAGNYIYGG